MIEHDTTALLDQLVARVEAGVPPTELILARGVRARTRRRFVGALTVAVAVIVLVGGTAVLARPDTSSQPDPQTSPTPTVTKPLFRDVAFDDLVGLWLPVRLTGPAVPWAGSEWGAVWFGDGVVSTTHDCTSWSGSIHNFSGVGGFNTVLEPSFQRCLAGAAEMDVGPDSSIVLRRARWVQLTGDLLTFYGMRDRVLGTYQRDWMPVRAGQLIGSWRPLRLFGEEPQRVNGRMPLLRFLTETSLLGLPLQRVVADDGVNDTSGLFRLGSGAAWCTSDLGTTLVGCLGDCPKVRNADVIQSAVRVQLVNGLLAFYDADGHMIGLYRRT